MRRGNSESECAENAVEGHKLNKWVRDGGEGIFLRSLSYSNRIGTTTKQKCDFKITVSLAELSISKSLSLRASGHRRITACNQEEISSSC